MATKLTDYLMGFNFDLLLLKLLGWIFSVYSLKLIIADFSYKNL